MDTPEMGEVKAGTSELGEMRRVWDMCMGVLRDPRGGESMVTVSKSVSLQTFLKSTEEPQRQELCHPP